MNPAITPFLLRMLLTHTHDFLNVLDVVRIASSSGYEFSVVKKLMALEMIGVVRIHPLAFVVQQSIHFTASLVDFAR